MLYYICYICYIILYDISGRMLEEQGEFTCVFMLFNIFTDQTRVADCGWVSWLV